MLSFIRLVPGSGVNHYIIYDAVHLQQHQTIAEFKFPFSHLRFRVHELQYIKYKQIYIKDQCGH